MRFCLLVVLLFSQACQSDSLPKDVTRGFYFWKSTFKLTPKEQSTLTDCHIQKLYIKAFDVDWDFTKSKAIPKASIHFEQSAPANLSLIPTIFITNQVIKQTAENQLTSLAGFINNHLELVWQNKPFTEVQFDCDWTISTRTTYFKLLTLLKKHFQQKTISATIRLHQIKFAHKTGIPPVDRGMLMFYNMSDWKKPQIKNSIYDLDAASQYVATLSKYPLPLDVVFPIFRWAIFYRNNRFLTVINNLDNQLLSQQSFLKKQDNKYYVLKDTSAFGMSLRKNDMIRTEEIDYQQLLKGSRGLSKQISTQKLTFALYHLDQSTISYYTNEQLRQIFLSFELPN